MSVKSFVKKTIVLIKNRGRLSTTQIFHSNISTTAEIYNNGALDIQNNVIIRKNVIVCSHNEQSKVVLGEGCDIGSNSRIAAVRKVIIGNNVLTGPNVFIADYNHKYSDPNKPIKIQGNQFNNGSEIIIGDGSWLGTNVVVVGTVHIGKNCVVGANSVVTKDLPDYSVCAGIPCKVLKVYNPVIKEWVRVKQS